MANIAVLYDATDKHPMVMTQDHVDAIAKHNPNGETRWYKTEESLLEDDFNAEILIAWGIDTPTAAFKKMTNCKWVQSVSAGVEGLQKIEGIKERGTILSKMQGVHGYVMAETCITYILCFLRSFPLLGVQQRKHIWKKPALKDLRECKDTTVGIIGMGDIGERVAYLCKKLDMTVLGCRRSAVEMENIDKMYALSDVDSMIPHCDFIVDLVPDTPASKNMVDAEFFKKMKDTAVFINIGRGATCDTDALCNALKNGDIAGAAIDAVMPEPLMEDSPLWDMENVIITPHCSADSPNYFERAVITIGKNIDSYLAGKGVPTSVNY